MRLSARQRIAAASRLALLGLLAAGALCLSPSLAAADPRPPNLIVVTTDDQTLESFNAETMPFTWNFFAEQGTRFNNAVVVSPSCCPSRAAFLSGQYPHNNGVFSNDPGYPSLRNKRNTLPVWLDNAGYRTAHVGKFLNGYGSGKGWKNPSPGFDAWYSLTTYRYYDYRIGVNGKLRAYGSAPRDYLTRRLNGKARRFVSRFSPRKRPLYLQLDQLAPHSETGSTDNSCSEAAQPDPDDLGLFADAALPQDGLPADQRSFNEHDVSDKSPVIAGKRQLSEFVTSKIRKRYRCQLEALRGVDRGMEELVSALIDRGAMRKTAIVFTSDNGFFHGEHRLPNNKGFPYEEGIRVPLLIRMPPSVIDGRPAEIDVPVSNIDITATLVDLAGAQTCRREDQCRQLDGRSLLPLISGETEDWPERRILIEQGRGQFFCAPYSAAWRPERLLIEYPTKDEQGNCTPEREYYETDADPLQLENLYPADTGSSRAANQSRLVEDLHTLTRCSGIEGRDPRRGGRPHCE